MILNVKVIPHAIKNEIKKEADHWKVHLTAPAEKGKANKLLIKLLSRELKLKKTQIRIIQGEKSRYKILQIAKEVSTEDLFQEKEKNKHR